MIPYMETKVKAMKNTEKKIAICSVEMCNDDFTKVLKGSYTVLPVDMIIEVEEFESNDNWCRIRLDNGSTHLVDVSKDYMLSRLRANNWKNSFSKCEFQVARRMGRATFIEWINLDISQPNHGDRLWIKLNGEVIQADFYTEMVGGIAEHTFCRLNGDPIYDHVDKWATLNTVF